MPRSPRPTSTCTPGGTTCGRQSRPTPGRWGESGDAQSCGRVEAPAGLGCGGRILIGAGDVLFCAHRP